MNTSIRCLQECCESLQDEREKFIMTKLIALVNSTSENTNIVNTLVESTGLNPQLVIKVVRQAAKYGKKNLGIYNVAESIPENDG